MVNEPPMNTRLRERSFQDIKMTIMRAAHRLSEIFRTQTKGVTP
jgi:hypothetical protein